jgi:hypothetical protein
MQFKKVLIMSVLLLGVLMLAPVITAQEDGETTTTTTNASNVNYFVVICSDRAVVNLAGTLLAGDDVYFQLFSGAGGTGEALSELRRVEAGGDYTFSEIVQYPEGKTIAAGGIGSAYIALARESNPNSVSFSDYVDDIQDGCADPLYTLGVSSTGAGSGTGVYGPGTTAQGTSNILSPFGGVLNPGYIPPAKDPATGLDLTEFVRPRQQTPGLIFAECDAFPVAEPGIVYDTDDVVVFWSWFASTAEQVQDHIDHVDYSVTYYQTLILPNVTVSEIQQIGGDYWVFYYSRLGNLLPGQYWIEYEVRWDFPITDGYEDFGPGTENNLLHGGCSFDVIGNPGGVRPSHNTWPYQNLG